MQVQGTPLHFDFIMISIVKWTCFTGGCPFDFIELKNVFDLLDFIVKS